MLSVNIGPLVIPAKALLLLAIALIAIGIGYLVGRSKRAGIANAVADMMFAGIVMARMVFVAQWFDVYHKTPSLIIDIRDGGFMLPAGIVSALLVGLWHAWRQSALRKPLVVNPWATWCPPCRTEMPVLAAAQQQERNVVFVFAIQGEDAATVQRCLTALFTALPLAQTVEDDEALRPWSFSNIRRLCPVARFPFVPQAPA